MLLCCSTLYEGLYVCKLQLWGDSPGTDQVGAQVGPGLGRYHQSFNRLDQRRCCCSQLPQSFKPFVICTPNPQGLHYFLSLSLPQRHPEKQFNLSSYPAKRNTAFLSRSDSEPSVLSNSQLSGAKKHNSNGKHTPPDALILARPLLKGEWHPFKQGKGLSRRKGCQRPAE